MKKILLGITLLLFSLSSHAVLLTYDLVYTSDTTAATGIGFVTIDDTVFSNTAANDFDVPAATLGITAFSLTISGASAGNGTFDLTDIGLFSWNRTAPYGLSMEILGQAGHVNFNIHSSIASSPVPPNAGEPFSGGSNNQITTDFGSAGAGEILILRSMTPRVALAPPTSVPTLSFWGLLLMTLLLPLVARRRIK